MKNIFSLILIIFSFNVKSDEQFCKRLSDFLFSDIIEDDIKTNLKTQKLAKNIFEREIKIASMLINEQITIEEYKKKKEMIDIEVKSLIVDSIEVHSPLAYNKLCK